MDSVTVVVTIGLAVGTGLAYLAYHHPAEYKLIYLALISIMLLVLCGSVAWDISNSKAQLAIYDVKELDHNLIKATQSAMETYKVPGLLWYTLISTYVYS